MRKRSTEFRPRHGTAATPDELAEQVQLFIAAIRAVPPEKLRAAHTPDWGPREILCHLVFWHAQYVSIIRALLAHKQPLLLTGSFKQHNADAVRQLSGSRIEELLASLERSQRELDRFAQLENIAALCFSFREGSKTRSFPEFVDVIANHFHSHRLQVQRLMGHRARQVRHA